VKGFKSKSIRLAGEIALEGPIEEVFPLFSPLGEKLWVPGWNPELLHPPGVSWEKGLIFRTQEETGDAIWVVTKLDHSAHEVEYYRVEPERYVAHIRVRCSAIAGQVTRVSASYEFIGLSDKGNSEIAAMTQDSYNEKMKRWAGWIRHLKSTWYVYIIRCSDDTLYTGIAKDVEKRVAEHNSGTPGGAKYTRSRRPVTLEHQEQVNSRSEAVRRELEIKKLNKKQKEILVRGGY
jgi:predicted GIY-YIG superfamily endonuclease